MRFLVLALVGLSAISAYADSGATAHADGLVNAQFILCRDVPVKTSGIDGEPAVDIEIDKYDKDGDYFVNGGDAGKNLSSDPNALVLNTFRSWDLFKLSDGIKVELHNDGTGSFNLRSKNESGGGYGPILGIKGTANNCFAPQNNNSETAPVQPQI
jgi:hypothetical protein